MRRPAASGSDLVGTSLRPAGVLLYQFSSPSSLDSENHRLGISREVSYDMRHAPSLQE